MPKKKSFKQHFKKGFRVFLRLLFLFWVCLAYWIKANYDEPCTNNSTFHITRVGILPGRINESSGLIKFTDTTYLTHNDDSDTVLYEIDRYGQLKNKYALTGVEAKDWECIAASERMLFIGDIGNNLNNRYDLCIYMVDKRNMILIDTIRFRYEDQIQFPPTSPKDMNFDAEAMIYWNDSIYIFTKNRFADDHTVIYKIHAAGGYQVAERIGRVSLHGQVTDAALDNTKKELALLTYGKVYFYPWPITSTNQSFTRCVNLYNARQCEAIFYHTNDTLYFTNEQRGLYRIVKSH